MFYINAVVTTKKVAIEYTQKEMRSESKHINIKKKMNKTEMKAIRQERKGKSYRTYRKP